MASQTSQPAQGTEQASTLRAASHLSERSSDNVSSDTSALEEVNPQQGVGERAAKRLRRSAKRTGSEPAAFGVFPTQPAVPIHEFVGASSMATVDFTQAGRVNEPGPVREIEHGPTDLPPRPYVGGKDAVSPFKRRTPVPSVPASALDELPKFEGRIARLEGALQHVLVIRGEEALERSQVPGLDAEEED